MINRYTQVSPSQFTPLSMQEIMMVPTMKRQQHDAAVQEASQFQSLLGNVNPHSNHYNEALNIQNQYKESLNSLVNDLNTEGVNMNTKGRVSAMRQKISDEFGPMGRLGQINAYNQNVAKAREDYMKQAKAAGQSAQIAGIHFDNMFKEHSAQPIYSSPNRINQFNVSSLPPEYVNFTDKMMEYGKSLGMTSSEIQRAGEGISFQEGIAGQDGIFAIKSGSSTTRGSKKNEEQRQALVNLMNAEILDPTSRIAQSMKYNFENPGVAMAKALTISNMLKEDSVTDRRSSSQSISTLVSGSEMRKQGDASGMGDTFATGQTTANTVNTKGSPLASLKSITKDIRSISENPTGTFAEHAYNPVAYGISKLRTNPLPVVTGSRGTMDANIDKLKSNEEYKRIANAMVKDKSDLYSVATVKKVDNYLNSIKDHQLSEKLISLDAGKAGVGISPMDTTTAKKRGETIRNRMNAGGVNTVYDEQGNPIKDFNAVLQNKKGAKKVEYLGMYDPSSPVLMNTTNAQHKIVPDKVRVEFENGDVQTYKIPKNAEDRNTSEFIKASKVNNVILNASMTPDIPVKFKAGNGTNVEVRNNLASDNYTISINGRHVTVSQSDLETWITNNL